MLLLGLESEGIRWDMAAQEGKGPGMGTLEAGAEGRQSMAGVQRGMEGRLQRREDRMRRAMCSGGEIVRAGPAGRGEGKAAPGQKGKKVDKGVEVEVEEKVVDTAIWGDCPGPVAEDLPTLQIRVS